MKFDIPDTIDTGVLAALSPAAFALLKPHLHYREFERGAVLWEAGDIVDRIFFPHSGLISVTMSDMDGHRVEVGSVGREGATRIFSPQSAYDARDIFVSPHSATTAAAVIPGALSYIAATHFAEAAQENDEIAALSSFCKNWLLLQSQHLAVCNAAHSADQRFCRWLLTVAERSDSDVLPVTQDEIANLLGIHRATVALIARRLERAGTLGHVRGRVIIRNPAKLRAKACDCHTVLSRANWPATRLAALHAGAIKRVDLVH